MIRYWASLRKLGRRVRQLEAALEAERERNRLREDALVDRILTLAGQYAISKQVKAEIKGDRPASPPSSQLTAYQEAVRTAYREAAVQVGRTTKEADEQFQAWLSGSTPAGERPFLETIQ